MMELRDMRLFLLLHAEGHLTRAAVRAGIGQPALSRALARWREELGDPLFVRDRDGMSPTPRADALAPRLRGVLDEVEAVLRPPEMEPSRLRRTFTVGTHEYLDAAFAPRLAARLAAQAPDVTVVTRPLSDATVGLADGLLDLVMGIRKALPTSARAVRLYEDPFVCAVRRGHPDVDDELDLDRYCRLAHLVVAPMGVAGGVVDGALASLGRERRVRMLSHTFAAAPAIVAGSDLVLTAPGRVVETLAERLGLRTFAPPLALPALGVWQAWPPRLHDDPEHAWFRRLVAELTEQPTAR